MAFSSHFKASMSLNSASFEQGLKKAQGKVKSFNKDLSGMFTRFLGATAVVAFGKSVLDSTAKLGDMSKRLGVSTDFLQKFNYAMEQNEDNDEDAEDDEEPEIPEDLESLRLSDPKAFSRNVLYRSLWMMLLGTTMVLLFSDPMVDVFSAFVCH